MSQNILFISDTILIERTTVHGNIDPKLLYPEIKTAQDMYILPILGTALFAKLQRDISAGTLTGYYTILINDYIIDTLIHYVLMELPLTTSFQFFNKGVLRSGGQDTEVPTLSDLVTISDNFKRKAEYYAERMKKFLIEENRQGNFPEYNNPGTRADTIHPYGGTFSLSVYLGDDDCGRGRLSCFSSGGGGGSSTPSTDTAYWGTSDTDVLIDEATILAGGSGVFSFGATIAADFTANAVPKYLWMAERTTEPVKTRWYVTSLNNAPIGASERFAIKGVQGSWRVYMSTYETQQTDSAIQFRVA